MFLPASLSLSSSSFHCRPSIAAIPSSISSIIIIIIIHRSRFNNLHPPHHTDLWETNKERMCQKKARIITQTTKNSMLTTMIQNIPQIPIKCHSGSDETSNSRHDVNGTGRTVSGWVVLACGRDLQVLVRSKERIHGRRERKEKEGRESGGRSEEEARNETKRKRTYQDKPPKSQIQ